MPALRCICNKMYYKNILRRYCKHNLFTTLYVFKCTLMPELVVQRVVIGQVPPEPDEPNVFLVA